MTKVKKERESSSTRKILEELKDESITSEAYLTGMFWCNSELYEFYSEEKINTKTFLNKEWAFYFGLGRKMRESGIKVFDELSIEKSIDDLNVRNLYEEYGEYDTIYEIVEEVEGYEENFNRYYDEVRKYGMMKSLISLIGKKVIEKVDKYDYTKMTGDQIYTFWNDKFNQIGISDLKYTEQFLLKGIRESVEEWDKNPDVGLPFYNSSKMTKICSGWDYGHVYIYGGFGGGGKTSITFNKVIMSCIENKEKLLVIANEQTCKEFQKLLVATVLGILGSKYRERDLYVERQRFNVGEFTDEERSKINEAIDFIEDIIDGDDSLVAFVFMEDYIIKDVKKVITRYNNRGYRSVLVDTGKPSDEDTGKVRWEAFCDDFKELYKIARPDAGGLNVRMWVNVQLADSALSRRFLNEHAFGDSKKIKNEASVVFMGRNAWDSEYEDGDEEVEVTRYVKTDPSNPFHNKDAKYSEEKFKLERGTLYFFMFTVKNRRGLDYKTGQRVLVMKPNFNNNSWYEIGWCQITDDRSY